VAPKSIAKSPGVPEFLVFLDEILHHTIRSRTEQLGFDVYRVDFSTWKLRLSDRTPVIVVSEADLHQPALDLGWSISEVVRVCHTANSERTLIALVQGDGAGLREYFETSFYQVAIIDRANQQMIMAAAHPGTELLRCLSRQLPLSALSPYETSKPVTGSRFFGRESSVRRLLTDAKANYAVMGIRRIGKTSLLREVERRWIERMQAGGDTEARQRVIFMDLSAIKSSSEFMREVVRKLQPRELARVDHRRFPLYFPDFLRRMNHQYHGPIFFLLDEFDELLANHSLDTQLLDVLRTSSNSDHARFIIAGFRDLLRASTDLDSPMFNFAKPLRLKEFTRSETATMIVDPMRNLGIQFRQQNEVVDRIFEETAGQPNLVQYYCATIIQQLDETNRQEVSPDDLFSVHENEDLRAFILNTFWDNTNHLEKAIVFSVISSYFPAERQFDLEAIDKALMKREVHAPLVDLEEACRDLALAGTFAQTGRYYHFATPLFPELLDETHNIDYLFRKILEEGSW
jgi:hypothetical protein